MKPIAFLVILSMISLPAHADTTTFVCDYKTYSDNEDGLQKVDSSFVLTFIVDNENKLMGALTDGDVRRYLLSGKGLEGPYATVFIVRNFLRILLSVRRCSRSRRKTGSLRIEKKSR